MLPIFISSVCAFLLVSLVLALIFSATFREAILGGQGEASILGLISVKGVAIVLLCALFLGGLIYPLTLKSSVSIGTEVAVNNCDDTCANKIKNLLRTLPSFTEDLSAKEIIRNTKIKIAALIKENKELQYFKNNPSGILSKFSKIKEDLNTFSPAIDFSYIPEKKKEAAYRILELLGRLRHYSHPPSYDPMLAKKALIEFQKKKNILPQEETKHGLLGRTTFLMLITEYISLEENGN